MSRQTKTVGLVMGDVASPFFPDVARGAEDVLAAAGYSLILSSSRRDPSASSGTSGTSSSAAPTASSSARRSVRPTSSPS